MELEEVEIYSRSSNVAVMRVPGRSFPGSVIQGDSLFVLVQLAIEAAERARAEDVRDEELLGLLEELQTLLLERLLHYQDVLLEHGHELPYAPAAESSQFVQLLPDEEADL